MSEHDVARRPLVYTPEEAADLLKVGRTKVYELMQSRHLRSVKIGRTRRIPATALERYVEQLLEEEGVTS